MTVPVCHLFSKRNSSNCRLVRRHPPKDYDFQTHSPENRKALQRSFAVTLQKKLLDHRVVVVCRTSLYENPKYVVRSICLVRETVSVWWTLKPQDPV